MRTRRSLLLVLEPPGPQRRELNRYAAELFAARGEASSLLLPDLLPLAWGRALPSPAPRLGELWKDLEGGFRTAGLWRRGPAVYLGIEGPLGDLARAAGELFDEPEPAPPFEPGYGFFLGRLAGEEGGRELPAPPELSWRAGRLLLLELEGELEGLSSLAWRELESAWRPRGGRPPRERDGAAISR